MSFPKHPGVYAITHVESGRRYIGSSKNIYNRWRGHLAQLRNNEHHSPYLQNIWNKYGESAFRFEVLEACLGDPVMLCNREQHWLDKSRKKLLNGARYADPNYGTQQSPELKEAARLRMLGNKNGQGYHHPGPLSEHDVKAILYRYAKGERSIDLAAEFKVAQGTISRIASRSVWWNVQVPPEVEAACKLRIASNGGGAYGTHAKMDWEKVDDARRRFASGESVSSLATSYGMTWKGMHNVVTGKTWNRPQPIEVGDVPLPIPTIGIPFPGSSRSSAKREYVPRPRQPKVTVTCMICDKKMERSPSLVHPRCFCSRECRRIGASLISKEAMRNPVIREKIAASKRGKKASDETRAAISAGHRRRREERKGTASLPFTDE